ncbi:zeta toxin family protein [Streptomyces sp. NPDC018045]|uniref:zeta toxin family protein n=1 Tax=Streptomyces sp. NPDC018045 TaxID=3365037 RepID=UPI0037A7A3BB
MIGQPGAGKTRAAWMVHRSLRDTPAHIRGDDFKQAHPDYLALLRAEPRTASVRIRADYRAWQAQAEAWARQQRGDVVIEATPGSLAEFTAAAALYRQAGYRGELVVLAVRAADSRQGTAARYTEMNRRGLPARFTTAAGHDASFRVLADVATSAEQRPGVDSVVVTRRDAHVLYRNARIPPAREPQGTGAGPAVVAEQSRSYTHAEAERFWAVQRLLRSTMPHYRGELIAIGAQARALMPPGWHPRRLDAASVAAALPVPTWMCELPS